MRDPFNSCSKRIDFLTFWFSHRDPVLVEALKGKPCISRCFGQVSQNGHPETVKLPAEKQVGIHQPPGARNNNLVVSQTSRFEVFDGKKVVR